MNYSIGLIKYSTNPNKLIVEVDQGIQDYYRSQIPIKTNKQKYGAHITVMRGEQPNKLVNLFHNQEIYFWYEHYLFNDNKYFWLNVTCPKLKDIRQLIGLNPTHELTYSPDGRNSFHITIANIKNL
jgi:hypothetical protein